MATRARKSKKEPVEKDDSLLKALEFVSLAQRNIGTHAQTHCIVKDGWCVASDSVISMGAPIPDDLGVCPQTSRFLAALRRCEERPSLTQLDADRLSVKAGKLRVVVPCVSLETIPVLWADANIAVLGEAFRDVLRAIVHIPSDGGAVVHYASILARGQTVAATTGRVLVEGWHGFDTPPYWVIPKPAVTALLKVDKPLVGLGFSGRSATFHFEDTSWLRTQLYEDKWPNLDSLFDKAGTAITPVPVGLFDAVKILTDFSDEGTIVKFKENAIDTYAPQGEHAEYEVKGLQEGMSFSLKDMIMISSLAKTLDAIGDGRMATFTGERLRGAISYRIDYGSQ